MNDPIAYMEAKVLRMKPGQRLSVGLEVFDSYDRIGQAIGTPFTGADRVLERIIGSGYEYGYFESEHDRRNRTVTFFRLEKPLQDGTRSYVSPDRRHLYNKRGDLFHPIDR